MIGQIALIALGSNDGSFRGDVAENVAWAVERVGALAHGAVRVSPFYATPAYPAGAGPDFVNAAMAFATDLDAFALLAQLHNIEAEAGRIRRVRWGQRSLDLDLIALGNQVLPDAATQGHWRNLPADVQALAAPESLILPHPRMHLRAFVLHPLAEIAPDASIPGVGTIADLLPGVADQQISRL